MISRQNIYEGNIKESTVLNTIKLICRNSHRVILSGIGKKCIHQKRLITNSEIIMLIESVPCKW